MALPLPSPDDRLYLTRSQAAKEFGVSADAIRRWERIGYLEPVVTSARGRSLYEFTAVADAELRAREAALATSGSGKRVERHWQPDETAA